MQRLSRMGTLPFGALLEDSRDGRTRGSAPTLGIKYCAGFNISGLSLCSKNLSIPSRDGSLSLRNGETKDDALGAALSSSPKFRGEGVPAKRGREVSFALTLDRLDWFGRCYYKFIIQRVYNYMIAIGYRSPDNLFGEPRFQFALKVAAQRACSVGGIVPFGCDE